MMILRKGLTDITTAGSKVSIVSKMTIYMGVLKFMPPFGVIAPKTGITGSVGGGAAKADPAANNRSRTATIRIIGIDGPDFHRMMQLVRLEQAR